MRRRTILAAGLALAATACSRRRSIYLQPGQREEPDERRAKRQATPLLAGKSAATPEPAP